jgi:hypothetical protein
MVALLILRDYMRWHYTRAFSDIFSIWRDLTYFVFTFFSIPLLFQTLFQPWKRIEAERERSGFDLQDYLSTKLVNMIMRLVGACMRLMLILIGLGCTGFVVIVGLQFFVMWVFLPLSLLLLMAAAISLIIFG